MQINSEDVNAIWLELNARLTDLSRQLADGIRSKDRREKLSQLNKDIRATVEEMQRFRKKYF
ncbi:hypothetical protein GCM10023184_28620 [Flaviaesturariibacter amylovorans]|uniref:General stress protein CsbD n=1 Tax=Flaviaesturariibacter amylovorans TaxID=1084520 RepID=A0ABP8H515_9BACT